MNNGQLRIDETMAMIRMAARFGGGPSLLCTPRVEAWPAGSAPRGLSYAAVMHVPNKCQTSAIQTPQPTKI